MTNNTVIYIDSLIKKLTRKQDNYKREITILDNRMIEMADKQITYTLKINEVQTDIDMILEIKESLKEKKEL